MCMGLVARAGALDAVERHDAVLERDFKLGFGLLHLLLANVGLRQQAQRSGAHIQKMNK